MKYPKVIFIIFFIFSFSVSPCYSEQVTITPQNSDLLVRFLLDIHDESSDKDYLSTLREWSSLLEKYNAKQKLTKNEMKVYLFMVHIAYQRALSHSIEKISKEIVRKFEAQPGLFLSEMKVSPFLLESACNGLKGHFLTFGEDIDRTSFITKHEPIFIRELGPDLGNRCVSIINGNL
ncbi:hypothetical protein D3OALGB2SA_640 [Olavius algarvensis associated proteobacterium Delta 3]|nr:hypothetical protein D3OALGB2SA_640 [Olavius algarvensis associated proteobacterium Delta 3]